MQSLKGQFLIATPALNDPNFAQSVLLMIHHDQDGAMGVIVNRPMNVTVAQACDQFADDIEISEESSLTTQPLFHGGPCETMLIALHNDESHGTEVIPGVFMSTDKYQVESLLGDASVLSKYIVGYAGWAAGQLEDEIALGSWATTSASAARVFDAFANLWDRLQAELSLSQWISIDRIPEDPTVN